MMRAGLCRQPVAQRLRIKLAVAPRNFPVVNRFVVNAVVMERCQQTGLDAIEHRADVNQIVIAQRQDVRLIGAVWRRGQSEQEGRGEMRQQAPIGRCRRMVEFIDDDVVEMRRRKPVEMGGASECLDRGEQQIGLNVAAATVVKANP